MYRNVGMLAEWLPYYSVARIYEHWQVVLEHSQVVSEYWQLGSEHRQVGLKHWQPYLKLATLNKKYFNLFEKNINKTKYTPVISLTKF